MTRTTLLLAGTVLTLGLAISDPAHSQTACDINGVVQPAPTGLQSLACGNPIGNVADDSTAVGIDTAAGFGGSATAVGSHAISATVIFGGSIGPTPFLEYIVPTIDGSTAIGAYSFATGEGSVAVGDQAGVGVFTVLSPDQVSFTAVSNGTAVGSHSLVTQNGGTALGYNAQVTGGESTAIGTNAVASNASSVALGFGAEASGFDSVAIGGASTSATATFAVSVGGGADATAINTTAIGTAADATGDNATSLGAFSSALGLNATALGSGATARSEDSIAIGSSVLIDFGLTDAIAIGDGNTSVVAAGAIAIGAGADATAANSVAIGVNSVADQADTVSVGSVGNERRIVNVAAGTAPTDAVNVSQLGAVTTDVTALQTTVSTHTTQIAALEDLVFEFADELDDVDDRAAAGTAAAVALSGGMFLPGKSFNLTGNVGAYRGAVAGAIQLGALVSDSVALNAGVAHGFNKGGKTAVRAGFTFGW